MSAFKTYWIAYGGFEALFLSGYLWASIIFSILLNPLWLLPEGADALIPWIGIAFSVLPGLIAFSLGAIAIFVALSRGLFLSVLQEGGGRSFFLRVVAAFFHFLLVQFSTLIFGLWTLAWPNAWLSFFGFTLFIYAIFTGVAAAAILVDVAEIKNTADPIEDEEGR